MKTFKQINQLNKKFVGLFFDEKTNNDLIEFSTRLGFNLTQNHSGKSIDSKDFNFHLTLFYTSSEHNSQEGEYLIKPIELIPVSFGLLGSENSVPVLNIDFSTRLNSIRNFYSNIGYKDVWPDYKPHVSLSYNYLNYPDMTKMRLPSFPLIANLIKIHNQVS